MTSLGYLLYLLLAAIIFAMWRRVRGLAFTDLIERSAQEHHVIQRIGEKHPGGGSWKEFKEWYRAAKPEG